MATIISKDKMIFEQKDKGVEEYTWQSIANLKDMVNPKNLKFNVRVLEQGKYSYPYHFHRHAEEMFVILEGTGKLRTPEGIKTVDEGDIIFFEIGPSGAHQIKNEETKPLKYLDIRTDLGMDVCEYPDSGKVNILPEMEIYEKDTQVTYFHGERDIKDIW